MHPVTASASLDAWLTACRLRLREAGDGQTEAAAERRRAEEWYVTVGGSEVP